MIVRVGLPSSTGSEPLWLEELHQPALLSAGSLWDKERQRFKQVGSAVGELDVVLDSSGFVRMALGAEYPWTVAQYVELAGSYSWTWWAQMDLPCEPEVAKDPDEVWERQGLSSAYLRACRLYVQQWRAAGADWLSDPLPVLQGWQPADYLRCCDLYEQILGTWPALVGVGSMCRRQAHGPVGLIAVLRALEGRLPPHVRLHLFGVKGPALRILRGNPRVESTDSQAWYAAARRRAFTESVAQGWKPGTPGPRPVPCDRALKRQELLRWIRTQIGDDRLQMGLF